jgi:hypothetical protein
MHGEILNLFIQASLNNSNLFDTIAEGSQRTTKCITSHQSQ